MEKQSTPLRMISSVIIASRWLQFPLYLGLIGAQCVYVFSFLKKLFYLFANAATFGNQEMMLVVLGLIDMVLISNLLIMVIIGGYDTFVSRLGMQGHANQPEGLSNVTAGVLKVKLAMAIVGVSSIHLLLTFFEASKIGLAGSTVTEASVMWQTIIHCVFVISAVAITFADRLSSPKQ